MSERRLDELAAHLLARLELGVVMDLFDLRKRDMWLLRKKVMTLIEESYPRVSKTKDK